MLKMALTRFIFLLLFWDYYSSIIGIGKYITHDILEVLNNICASKSVLKFAFFSWKIKKVIKSSKEDKG